MKENVENMRRAMEQMEADKKSTQGIRYYKEYG